MFKQRSKKEVPNNSEINKQSGNEMEKKIANIGKDKNYNQNISFHTNTTNKNFRQGRGFKSDPLQYNFQFQLKA